MYVSKIKYGFLIVNSCIYDTKIQSYELKISQIGSNIIYYMKPKRKRLYFYEPLLYVYSVDKVFEILNFNRLLKKKRKSESLIKNDKLHYMANMSVIYNYPPSYLTQKKFALYKKCQSLKRRLD